MEAIITCSFTLLVWVCFFFLKKNKPTNKQQIHQNPALLEKLFTYHNFKTHQFEVFWHLKVNVDALTTSDTSGWACHFSSPLLPFIKPVLLNCSISLLSWIAMQIKSHFVSWLKSSSKVFSITSSKKLLLNKCFVCHLSCHFLRFYFGSPSY